MQTTCVSLSSLVAQRHTNDPPSPLAKASIFFSMIPFVERDKLMFIAPVIATTAITMIPNIFFFIVIIILILNSFRPFSSIYPFNERDDVCLKISYLYTFFFLGDGVVSEVFLQGLFRLRHFLPFIVFIGFDFFILLRNLLASGRAT